MNLNLNRNRNLEELIELCGICHKDLEDAVMRVRDRYMKLLREGKTHDSAMVDREYKERISGVERLKEEYKSLLRAL